MIIKTETKIIMGHKYVVTLFPATQGYLLGRKLYSLFDNRSQDLDISKLCEIDKDGSMMWELLSYTIRDEQVINEASFNKIYSGNYKEMFAAAAFVFEVNFKDFFQDGDTGEEQEDLVAPVKQKAQSKNA